MQTEDKTSQENPTLLPHEMTFAEFEKFANVIKLENHGRKWDVRFQGGSGFSDAPEIQGAIRDVHQGIVNNALYSNTEQGVGVIQKTTMPPQEVLDEYPFLRDRYPELFDQVEENLIVGLPAIKKELSADDAENSIIGIGPASASPAPQTVETEKQPRSLLNGRYTEKEPGVFYRLDSDKPMLRDEGSRLRIVNKDIETFKAAMELAAEKGWAGIKVSGTKNFRAEAWFQASMQGLEVEGYDPNENDLKRLETARTSLPSSVSNEVAVRKEDSRSSAEKYVLERDGGVVHPAMMNEQRTFSGRVVQTFDEHIVQDIGRNTFVVHDKARVGEVDLGKRLDIAYKGREAIVKPAEVRREIGGLSR